jgi:hypothetical protein
MAITGSMSGWNSGDSSLSACARRREGVPGAARQLRLRAGQNAPPARRRARLVHDQRGALVQAR